MLFERIKKEYDDLSCHINTIQQELQTFPPGKLICCHQANTSKWYYSDGHHKTYIPKSNRPFAEQLARKKYLSKLLEDLKTEQTALAFYLRHHSPTSHSEQFLTEPSEYQKLLLPSFKPLSQELATWMNSPYEKNPAHPENLIFKGIGNTYLRSKSEVLIDMLLRTYNIPFRYESALQLGNTIIYPDFTIRHPHTGSLFYWEHFGMMDIPSYISNATAKINLYASHGITPGIQLITTYETKEHPLNPEIIKNYIELHFL